jgi:uncharacterized membrane protein
MAKGKHSYAKKRRAEQAELKRQKKVHIRNRIRSLPKRYFIDAMGAMALGLFASLLIGTIFDTLGNYIPWDGLKLIASYAKAATGMAIGVAIAYKLEAHPLVIFSCAGVGALGNAMGAIICDNALIQWAATASDGEAGHIFYSAGPAGAFFAVILAAEVGMLVSKKTPVDILVTPVVTLLAGFAGAWVFCPLVSYVMYFLGIFIASTTTLYPLFMGIIVSVVVGIILTLPISSAAICAMIFSPAAVEVATANGTLEGLLLAGGAAVAGCCAQMVGFAVSSFRENKWGGLVSQGLGTSMLQMGNICRWPVIWVPPTLAAAIVGPLSTMVFKLECTGVAAGMGTCGMVGPIGVIASTEHSPMMWVGLAVCCVIAPAVLSLLFSEIMRKLGWIRYGDMKLDA